jgi:RimJ/RimL family protein N-acetyltransferase
VRLGLARRRLAGAARLVVGGAAGPVHRPALPSGVFPVGLRAGGVALRELGPGDADAFVRLAGDIRVTHFMKTGPLDRAAALRALEWKLLRARFPGRSDYELAVDDGGRFAGTVTLHLVGTGTAELAFWLLPEAAGRGVATDACDVLLRFGAEQLDVHRVFATCDAENDRAVALLERLGMVREGYMRDAALTHLGWRDRLLYARLLDGAGA